MGVETLWTQAVRAVRKVAATGQVQVASRINSAVARNVGSPNSVRVARERQDAPVTQSSRRRHQGG